MCFFSRHTPRRQYNSFGGLLQDSYSQPRIQMDLHLPEEEREGKGKRVKGMMSLLSFLHQDALFAAIISPRLHNFFPLTC